MQDPQDPPEERSDQAQARPVEPPVRRAPGDLRAPRSKLFALPRRKPRWTDLGIPLLMVALVILLAYVRYRQGGLWTRIVVVNGTSKPVTLQVGLERTAVKAGGWARAEAWNPRNEELNILSRQGVEETVTMPEEVPPNAIYNCRGQAFLVLVDYTWAYGAAEGRPSEGPQFKVVARLKGQKLFLPGPGELLGPGDPLPGDYHEPLPLLRVEEVPEREYDFPEGYLRARLAEARGKR